MGVTSVQWHPCQQYVLASSSLGIGIGIDIDIDIDSKVHFTLVNE